MTSTVTEPLAAERVAGITPRLLVHYAPGVLAVLRRDHCRDIKHFGDVGCDRSTHTFLTVVGISGLEPGEQDDCLAGCDWPRRQEVLF